MTRLGRSWVGGTARSAVPPSLTASRPINQIAPYTRNGTISSANDVATNSVLPTT